MALLLAAALVLPAGDAPDFATEVLPVLSDHCFHCHGPDAATRKAGLRLDTREGALSVIEPGDLELSDLHGRVVDEDPDWLMPPPEFERPLEQREVELLAAWIEAGAPWEEHWAFAPVVDPASGEVASAPGGDPIDALVEAVLSEEGLTPAPEADAATWLRRVTLDLTGLPPTVEEQDSFEAALAAGPAAAARAAVVDALLASRAHAEHRTREWLDVARYADTNGYQNDFRRDQWPWRDWVLRAFQGNLPYDRFVLEQVAGDLVEPRSTSAVLATGFQRNHRMVTEAGSIDEEWRVENVADRAETTATAFLGLTLACARCHDHKYDALTQEDYYRFYAFFDSIDEKGVYQETRGNVPPLVRVPSEAQTARLQELEARIVELERAASSAAAGVAARHESWRAARDQQAAALEAPALALDAATLNGTREAAPDLGTAISFERDRPFTVSLWLKPESHGAVYARMADDDTYQGTDLVLLGDMRPAVHLIHSWTEDAIKVVGARPLVRGVWQHVAVTYDGSSKAAGVTLHIDGEPVELRAEVDRLKGSIQTDAPLRVGTRRYAGDLTGEVLDLRIDGVALGREEVLALASERALSPDGTAFFAACFDEESGALRESLTAATEERDRVRDDEIPTAMVLAERAEPRVTRLLDRGRYDQPTGEPLEPGIPALFGELGGEGRKGRLELGRWLVDPANPLTARVAVNRVWASFFGVGLSATQEDFGVRGERPRHMALLDHLAASLVASGWDLRALERRIALSAVYGRSSAASPEALERDPANRLLARGPRHRLDAEALRDQALAAAGLLRPRFGGPPVKPYQPAGLWTELAGGAGQGAYVPSEGDDLFRRSVYTYRKRTVPHPTLTTFDAPGFEFCAVRRPRTNTPLQALATLNDVTYVEAARHLAERMMESSPDARARLAHGFRAVLARRPSPAEAEVLAGALAGHLADVEGASGAVNELLGVGATAPPEDERTPEWAAYTLLASTLLNLDEALTKR
ncbi:MAG: DUF1553 domain-containing protein [Planctomycetota bacterium]|nr:DUF1553 domain-containing protein [Planctomycetota bacterium]